MESERTRTPSLRSGVSSGFLSPPLHDAQLGGGSHNGAFAAPLPSPRRPEAVRRRLPLFQGARPRVVLLEDGASDHGPGWMVAELDVVERLTLPIDPVVVDAVLALHRPSMLLSTAPLDVFDGFLLEACHRNKVRMFVLARPAYGLLGPVRLYRFGGAPWLCVGRSSRPEAGILIKRMADVVLVLASVPLTVPMLLAFSALTCWGGPPLYFQERVGEGGRTFRLVKLRTMRVDAERSTGAVLASDDDQRMTRAGRILRRLRLDELPQLWNVLMGDMSLVGPRPERPELIADFCRLPDYETRHLVRPGITGIAQLTGGYSAPVGEKLRCDLLYMNCRSLRLDLKLLVLTVADFLRGFPRG